MRYVEMTEIESKILESILKFFITSMLLKVIFRNGMFWNLLILSVWLAAQSWALWNSSLMNASVESNISFLTFFNNDGSSGLEFRRWDWMSFPLKEAYVLITSDEHSLWAAEEQIVIKLYFFAIISVTLIFNKMYKLIRKSSFCCVYLSDLTVIIKDIFAVRP